MALEGSLSDFGLADILQLICFQRKTGVLELEGRMDKVKVVFIDGSITGAESKRRVEDSRLGKILLKKGLLKDAELKEALSEQKKTGARIGNVLLRRGLVSRETMEDIIKAQITETVIQLFAWKQGTYEFTTQSVPKDRELPLSLDTQHLLMEGLRIVDELSVVKDRISPDTIFVKEASRAAELSEEEREVLSFIDGENDVGTIIDLMDRDSFQVSKALLSLVEKRVIREIEARPILHKIEPPTRAESPFSFLEAIPRSLLGILPPLAIVIGLVISFSVVLAVGSPELKDFRASEEVSELRLLIEAYKIDRAAYPASLEEISKAVDPWGRPYLYKLSGRTFSVFSSGPDEKEGTPDDIY